MLFDFSPAKLTIANGETKNPSLPLENVVVGWFLLAADINSASARYRCFHPALALSHQGIHSHFFSEKDALIRSLKEIQVLVIVKRLDLLAITLTAQAVDLGISVYIDICDDIISTAYRSDSLNLHQMVLRSIAPYLSGIIVTGSAMRDRVNNYLQTLSIPPVHIFIVPDVAEDDKIVESSRHYSAERIIPRPTPPSSPNKKGAGQPSLSHRSSKRKSVLWFGNYGAPHTNFGMLSLLPAISPLRKVSTEVPLELVIVSNNQPLFEAAIQPLGLPCRYVEWSQENVYRELKRAHVALLANGDDEFCSIKSSNRAVLALQNGCPVVATNSPSLLDLESCIVQNDLEMGLRLYLCDAHSVHREAHLNRAQQLLAEFSLQSVSDAWIRALSARKPRQKAPDLSSINQTILAFIANRDSATQLLPSLEHRIQLGQSVKVLSTYEALQSSDKLREFLITKSIIPTVINSGNIQKNESRRLRNADALLIAPPPHCDITKTLLRWAAQRGVEVLLDSDEPKRLTRSLSDSPLRVEKAPPQATGHKPETSNSPAPAKGSSIHDWIFNTPQESKGWILEAICREIGTRHQGSWNIAYNPKQDLPAAKNYFFSHYWNYLDRIQKQPKILESNCFIWHTHPRPIPYSIQEQIAGYNKATKVIFTCSDFLNKWLVYGIEPHRACVVLGAADPQLFHTHTRGSGAIGLSSSFYARKNPDLLLSLVKSLPHRRFILVGKGWDEYHRFPELLACRNFEYHTVKYEDYPRLYAGFDVFLSLAVLEGGPIPLIESMMCNAVPVASRTGFAPDLITHGKNGFIFDVGSSPEVIADLIEKAFQVTIDVRSTVIQYDWDTFARTILSLGNS